tara:strand:- start:2353 stop:2514 length:162 start_codon:yes stop_codon:yes gene_type:complete
LLTPKDEGLSLKHVYLIFCVLGAALPFFYDQLQVNPVSRFFVFDVVISALVWC